jgi:hypothetical protein
MQAIGNNKARRASNNAYVAEKGRQTEMQRRQDAVLDQSYDSLNKLKDPNAEQAAIDKRKAAFVAALNARPADSAYLPGQDAAPAVVGDAAAASGAREGAFSAQQAEALARMTGMGDQLFDTNINLNRGSQEIGQVARDRINSANALDAELRAAAFKGQTLRGLGGLATTIGFGKALGGGGGGVKLPPVNDVLKQVGSSLKGPYIPLPVG